MGKTRLSKGKNRLKVAIKQAKQAYASVEVDSEEEAPKSRGRKNARADSDEEENEDAVLDLAIDDDSDDNDDDNDDDDDDVEDDEDEDEEEEEDKYAGRGFNHRSSSNKLTKKAQPASDSDNDDSDGDSDDDEDGSDSDSDSDLSDSNELKKLVDNLDPKIRQKIMMGDAAETSSDEEDSDDDGDNNWGRKKNYYNGDTGDLEIGQDIQDAEDEEVAAVELHKKTLTRMKDEDFFDDVEPENAKKSKKLLKVSNNKDDSMSGGSMFGNLKFIGLGNTKKQQVSASLSPYPLLRIIMSTICCDQSTTWCIYIYLCNINCKCTKCVWVVGLYPTAKYHQYTE